MSAVWVLHAATAVRTVRVVVTIMAIVRLLVVADARPFVLSHRCNAQRLLPSDLNATVCKHKHVLRWLVA